MKVTTRNNGNFNPTGAGYGIRIPREHREMHIRREWASAVLNIEDKTVEIKFRDTFWTTCYELRNKEIGAFLIKNKLGVWEKGRPHSSELLL